MQATVGRLPDAPAGDVMSRYTPEVMAAIKLANDLFRCPECLLPLPTDCNLLYGPHGVALMCDACWKHY